MDPDVSDHSAGTTTTTTPGSVVVGVDGSDSSGRALAWGMRQAALERRPLSLVHAVHLGPAGDNLWMSVPGAGIGLVLEDLTQAGRALLATTVDQVRRTEPDLVVEEVLVSGDPREVLLGCARTASLTVLGSRGRGMMRSLLLGSVSLTVSQHARGPVVVVRRGRSDVAPGGVLVEVTGAPGSTATIELAYEVASFRSLPLTALHVFHDADFRAGSDHAVADDEEGLDDERAVLAESVAGMGEKYPDVRVRLALRRGLRDLELVRASETVEIVVLGSHHREHPSDYLHTSVAATVVERATCDVIVVPVGTS